MPNSTQRWCPSASRTLHRSAGRSHVERGTNAIHTHKEGPRVRPEPADRALEAQHSEGTRRAASQRPSEESQRLVGSGVLDAVGAFLLGSVLLLGTIRSLGSLSGYAGSIRW